MAEEKSKKSIIASDDNDDEYSCDTVSELTELSSVLDKLSLGPKKEKKKLLILSPSGILLHRVHRMDMFMKPKNCSPDATCGPNLDLKDKLMFVWGQRQCTNSGLNTLEHIGRPLFFKDLSKVFQRFNEFSASNTILIDDEPYKALLNADNTGVFPVTYDPADKNDDLLDPEGEFCSYLDDLANASDVQAYIKENLFGRPKIDSAHPDWSFYSKVLKMFSYDA